jgi:hypothetical protein
MSSAILTIFFPNICQAGSSLGFGLGGHILYLGVVDRTLSHNLTISIGIEEESNVVSQSNSFLSGVFSGPHLKSQAVPTWPTSHYTHMLFFFFFIACITTWLTISVTNLISLLFVSISQEAEST